MITIYNGHDHENLDFSLSQKTHESLEEFDEYLDEQLKVGFELANQSEHSPPSSSRSASLV
jgi:hypothetical protein